MFCVTVQKPVQSASTRSPRITTVWVRCGCVMTAPAVHVVMTSDHGAPEETAQCCAVTALSLSRAAAAKCVLRLFTKVPVSALLAQLRYTDYGLSFLPFHLTRWAPTHLMCSPQQEVQISCVLSKQCSFFFGKERKKLGWKMCIICFCCNTTFALAFDTWIPASVCPYASQLIKELKKACGSAITCLHSEILHSRQVVFMRNNHSCTVTGNCCWTTAPFGTSEQRVDLGDV